MLWLHFSQGELAHCLVKRLYGLTNKQDTPEQIGCHYSQGCHFDEPGSQDTTQDSHKSADDNPPELHHSIANCHNNPVQLASFSSGSMQDPAAKVYMCPPPMLKCSPSPQDFIYKLRIHLLSWLLDKGLDGDDPSLFTDEE